MSETLHTTQQAIISTPWMTCWVSEDGYMGVLDMDRKVKVEHVLEVVEKVMDCMDKWHPHQGEPEQLELFGEGEV